MHSISQFHPVPLIAIDLKDGTYCLTPWEGNPHNDDLVSSIRQFGILHPPILKQKKNSSYCIVAGRKRILAAQHLAPDNPIFCRIIPADMQETAIFSLLLEEAATGKPLSIVEQIIFFEKLLHAASMDEAIPLLTQLGHKPQKHILDDLLKLHSLSETVLKSMHDGTLHLKNARKLLNLSKADQDTIARLITNLHFGGSKQQKLIDLCTELIMRRNLPLENILTHFLHADASGQEVNIPQQGVAILTWLHNECFPQMCQAENNFNRQVARLDLPSTMHISHTPAFENEETTLSLRFPDWKSLVKTAEEIRKFIQKE